MADTRFDQALSRIEAALARLEQLAASVPQDAAEAEARHAALRSGAGEALARLDQLIAARGG
ncbi:hypothetical protein [Sphingomonas morindae]|uniref:Uncharacterized protein n=1 Tax=Sphingomonas morindae TaxID=1541170 RepID=A0ABY4X9S7_9SPHN|nr:hypothetical protein [Sphingomonas morindae]USI73697.1 hypothetical protein LHA26_04290 [Sphingomonas morindae]